MLAKYLYIAISIFLIAVFSFCIHRDVQIEKQYTGDLRNRVVGARLQMDGKLPYFYKWHPGDSLRYYDPIRIDTTYANAITASPFYHHLLYPIANWPESKISIFWLWMEYAMAFIAILLAYTFTENILQRWLVTITGGLFLLTKAWLTHVAVGQNYIFFPMLCLLFLFFLRRRNNLLFSFLAGTVAITLILSRPIAVLIFLPFLLLLKKYPLRQILIMAIPCVLLTGYSIVDKSEHRYWAEYFKAIAAHAKNHQSNDRESRAELYVPTRFSKWEGLDQDAIDSANRYHPLHINMEYAGVQQIIKRYFKIKMPSQILSFCSAAIIILLLVIFYMKKARSSSASAIAALIFGFCLYMIADLFSPILRIQYYTVQWIFPLLICAALYKPGLQKIYLLLMVGLLLNIISQPYYVMRHTIGEYLILLTLLLLCLSGKSELISEA